jgi:hypothetical protein
LSGSDGKPLSVPVIGTEVGMDIVDVSEGIYVVDDGILVLENVGTLFGAEVIILVKAFVGAAVGMGIGVKMGSVATGDAVSVLVGILVLIDIGLTNGMPLIGTAFGRLVDAMMEGEADDVSVGDDVWGTLVEMPIGLGILMDG